jgi:hypothetical protein
MLHAFRRRPNRYLARCPVRKHPIRPVGIVKAKGAAEIYDVDVEAVQHVAVNHRHLLLDVIYPNRLGLEA